MAEHELTREEVDRIVADARARIEARRQEMARDEIQERTLAQRYYGQEMSLER